MIELKVRVPNEVAAKIKKEILEAKEFSHTVSITGLDLVDEAKTTALPLKNASVEFVDFKVGEA